MGTVDYDLDGDSGDLVRALDAVVAALTDASSAARRNTSAVADVEKAQDKLAGKLQSGKKGWDDYAAAAAHTTQSIKAVYDWAKWLVEGLQAVVERGLAARESLGDLISSEAKGRLDDYANQVEDLGVAADKLAAEFTASLTPELSKLTDVLIGGAEVLGEFFAKLEEIRNSEVAQELQLLARAMEAVVTLGASEALRAGVDGLADAGEAATEQIEELTAAQREQAKLEKESQEAAIIGAYMQMKADRELAAAQKTRAEQEKAAAEDSARSRQESLAWLERTGARELEIIESTRRANAAAAQVHLADLAKESAAIEEFGKQVIDGLNAETAAFVRDQEALQRATSAMLQRTASTLQTLVQTGFDAMGEEASAALDAIGVQIAASEERIRDLEELKDQGNMHARELLEEEKDRLHELRAEEKRLQREAFEDNKTAQKGNLLMASAVATIQAYAQLGPVFGTLAAAAIAAASTFQYGIIDSQTPPAHDGAMLGADEFEAFGRTVRRGESAAVFSQRATETGAAARAVDAANRDRPMGGEVRLVLGDAGRVIGELVAREVRRPGSPLVVGSTGVVDPYRRV